jgi:hypothetical protein
MKRNHAMQGVGTLVSFGLVACGGGARSHEVPWEAPRTQIIDSDRTAENVAAPEGQDCLHVAGADGCIKPQDKCGEGISSDVILDTDGKVLQVICYPKGDELSVEEVNAEQGDIPQTDNNAVLALDGADDGADVMGNLSIDANNVVVYGKGPDVSVVAGDVSVDGNNIIIHGVRIQGNVDVIANNAYFVDCVIEGDLTIDKNDAVVSSCDVLGKTIVRANNAALTANRFASAPVFEGKNARCADDYLATDANMNDQLSDDALGAAITCDDGKDGKN